MPIDCVLWRDQMKYRYPFGCIVCLAFLVLPAIASPTGKTTWKIYHAAIFDVSYPAQFTIKPSLRSQLCNQRYDSVFFISPDRKVTFYAGTSLYRENEVDDIKLNPKTEILVSSKTDNKMGIDDNDAEYEVYKYTWQTIRAKDGSYTRALLIACDTREKRQFDQAVFGFRYADQQSYNKYRADYLTFRNSMKARIYYGGTFSMVYPFGFITKPSLRCYNDKDGYIMSAFCTSPDKQAEFYIFTPWPPHNGPTDYQVDPKKETVVSTQNWKGTYFGDESSFTRQIIQAKDDSYTRSVLSIVGADGKEGFNYVVFGFKYRNRVINEKYKLDFEVFQNSIRFFHWD